MAAVADAPGIGLVSPGHMTILYDETCALCRRARDWLLTQPCLVPVTLMAAGSLEAKKRYGATPWLGRQLVAVDQEGNAWVGPSAFIAVIWATKRYRSWAYRLSRPGMRPYAEAFFDWISKRRTHIGHWLGRSETCPGCRAREIVLCPAGHRNPAWARFCKTCGRPCRASA